MTRICKPKNRANWSDILTYDRLYDELINKKRFAMDLAHEIGCNDNNIYKYLKQYNLLETYRQTVTKKICGVCSNEFIPGHWQAKFCSRRCIKINNRNNKINEIGMDVYRERHKKTRAYANGQIKFKEKGKQLRTQLLSLYGHKCECCGESHEVFLTLEHKKGDGNAHRKMYNGNTYKVWQDAIDNYDTTKYGILCWNCNCATKDGAICPHKEVI